MACNRRKRRRSLSVTFVNLYSMYFTAFRKGELAWALVALPNFLRERIDGFVGGLHLSSPHVQPRWRPNLAPVVSPRGEGERRQESVPSELACKTPVRFTWPSFS